LNCTTAIELYLPCGEQKRNDGASASLGQPTMLFGSQSKILLI